MDLQRLKALAFLHCEKAVLAIVLLFVGLNVSSNLSEQAEEGPPPAPRPGAPRVVSRALQPQVQAITSTFTEIPKAVKPPYNITRPTEAVRLGLIRLRMPGPKEERKEWPYENRKTVPFEGRTVGEPKVVKSEPDDIAGVSKEKSEKGDPCVAKIASDNEKGVTNFLAVKDGKPVTYEWKLASGDWLRFTVYVEPEGTVTLVVLGRAEITAVSEQVPGVVALRILEPPEAKKLDDQDPVTKHVDPTTYYVFRRAESEKEPTKIGTIKAMEKPAAKAGAPAVEPPPKAVVPPGGFPGKVEHKGPAVKGEAPGPAAAPKLERNEITFEDRNVEPGVTYLYSIESLIEDEQGNPAKEPEPKWDKDHKWTAVERYNLVYIGGTDFEARIRVLIGPRDKPVATEDFKVWIGGRIGEKGVVVRHPRPADKGGKEGDKEGKEGKEEAEPQPAPNQFATGFVLVDILPDRYRLVEQSGVKYNPETKKQEPVTTYRAASSREIVVRQRKGELVGYGAQTGPLREGRPKEPTPPPPVPPTPTPKPPPKVPGKPVKAP